MRYELVVCDLSGTTIADGDAVNKCLRKSLSRAGLVATPAAVDRVMGLPKPESLRLLIEEFAGADRERLLGKLEAIHDDFVSLMIDCYERDPNLREVEGTSSVFRALKNRGVRVAVDTGFSRKIADILIARTRWIDEGLVAASAASDDVPRGRPYPDMIQYIMYQLGVNDPARVVKIGDTPADLNEGTAAGCGLVIGVTSGTHTKEQLAQFPHDRLVESIRDLPSVLFPDESIEIDRRDQERSRADRTDRGKRDRSTLEPVRSIRSDAIETD